jgi:hypothetical protein
VGVRDRDDVDIGLGLGLSSERAGGSHSNVRLGRHSRCLVRAVVRSSSRSSSGSSSRLSSDVVRMSPNSLVLRGRSSGVNGGRGAELTLSGEDSDA